MIDASKVTVTAIYNGVPGGAGTGDTVHFTFNDTQYRYESWSTDNMSGSDFYQLVPYEDEDVISNRRERWLPAAFNDETREVFEYWLDESVLPYWWAKWQEIVQPKVDEAAKIAAEACNHDIVEDLATAAENVGVE